jgi:hypothetical protein
MQATPTSAAAFPLASPSEKRINKDWLSAAPDLLAFVVGLAAARWAGWSTGDLIWSLWLSSFVVGSATILWIIGVPSVKLAILAWQMRHDPGTAPHEMLVEWALIFVGALFMLAFFTAHFGGFHYGDAEFLFSYFPITLPGITNTGGPGKAEYLEILRRYWIFLPAAFLSHRAMFLRAPLTISPDRRHASFADYSKQGGAFAEPYKNVLRMHFVIMFFCFVDFLGLENFFVYAVVYAVYFFPWRLVRNEGPDSASARAAAEARTAKRSGEPGLEALLRQTMADRHR